MSHTNKTFILFIIILFVVVIFEFSYYQYLSSQNVPYKLAVASQKKLGTNLPKEELPYKHYFSINPEVVEVWKSPAFDTNIKTTFKIEIQVKIVEISTSRTYKGEMYPYSINVEATPGGKTGWIMYSKDKIDKAKFFLKKGDKTTPINIGDIQVGDTIRSEEEYNPFLDPKDPNQVSSLVIYKL